MKRIIVVTVAFLLAISMKAQSARIAAQGFQGFVTEMNQSTSAAGDHFSIQVQMTSTPQGETPGTSVVQVAPMTTDNQSVVVQEEITAGVVQEELTAGRTGATGRNFYEFIIALPKAVGHFVCGLFRAN